MLPLNRKVVTGFRESFLFAQFRQDTEILERRRVAGYTFATGDFLE